MGASIPSETHEAKYNYETPKATETCTLLDIKIRERILQLFVKRCTSVQKRRFRHAGSNQERTMRMQCRCIGHDLVQNCRAVLFFVDIIIVPIRHQGSLQKQKKRPAQINSVYVPQTPTQHWPMSTFRFLRQDDGH